MSQTESTSKKSILTTAMEAVAAKKTQSDASSDEQTHPAFKADNRRFKKIAVVAAVATVAVIAVSWKALSNMAPVEDETSEETTED